MTLINITNEQGDTGFQTIKMRTPENIHTHPKEGHWKLRGGLKSQIF